MIRKIGNKSSGVLIFSLLSTYMEPHISALNKGINNGKNH